MASMELATAHAATLSPKGLALGAHAVAVRCEDALGLQAEAILPFSRKKPLRAYLPSAVKPS